MNILISTVAFIYCMYLISCAVEAGFGCFLKNGLNVCDSIMMLLTIALAHYTINHWTSDLREWTEPHAPEDKENR